MKKSIAVLSALLLGLSYCPPGAVAMAMEDPETYSEDKNSFVDDSLSNEDESISEDQTLTENDKSLLSEDELLSQKEGNLSAGQTLSEIDMNSSTDQVPLDNESLFAERLWKKIVDNTGEKKDQQANAENERQQDAESMEDKTANAQLSGLKNLQIPQKLDVVIDPWEMDGKGQVYSDVYVIRNTGDTSGVLTLSNLACRPREQSGVVVKTEKDDLHDSSVKYIYMEMLFGNGDRIIFSSEKSQYQTELKPGEELSICFSGEVNENAFEKWKDQDVAVSVVYSWEAEDALADLNPEEPEEKQTNILDEDEINDQEGQQQINAEREDLVDDQETDVSGKVSADDQQADANGEESADCQQTDASVEESADIPQTATGMEEKADKQKEDPEEKKQEGNLQDEADKEPLDSPQVGINQESIIGEEPEATNDDTQQEGSTNITDKNEKESERIYNTEEDQTDVNSEIAAEAQQTSEGTVSSDEKEKEEIKNIELQEPKKSDIKIDSWNIDENGRIVSHQYLLYNAGDTTGIWTLSELVCKPQESDEIRVTTDKKVLHDSEDKSVYMVLVLGNGEKVVLSQERSTYEVKLEPGEKLAVRFIGEMNGNLFESREEWDIAVTAVCSWDRD